MSAYIVTDSELVAIANAIRTKNSSSLVFTIDQVPDAIESIGENIGSGAVTRTANGNSYIVNETKLIAIADAIRAKLGNNNQMTVAQMPNLINNIYNIFTYRLTNNEIILAPGGVTTYLPYGVCMYTPATDNRRIIGLENGIYPYIDKNTGNLLNIYPIPIPNQATTVTITGTPNTLEFDISTRTYNKETKYSASVSSSGWISSGTIVNLPNNVKYLTCSVRYEDNSIFENNPNEILIIFE